MLLNTAATWEAEVNFEQSPQNANRPRALHFGSAKRPLFGFLHEPHRRDRRVGLVLCNPFGYEAICTHRSYRHLAERLAANGYSVLRFDYDGTGDSFGADGDPNRVGAWVDSIHAAIAKLNELSAIEHTVLFGTRLGGLLALRAACESNAVTGLVLWSPCSSGKAYLRELRALRQIHEDSGAIAITRSTFSSAHEEAVGFLITRETRVDLHALDMRRLPPCGAERALLIGREELPGDLRSSKDLERLGLTVETEILPGYTNALLDPHRSEVPTQVFDAIERWLDSNAASWNAAPRVSKIQPLLGAGAGALGPGPDVTEQPVRFGARDLFGILTEPNAWNAEEARHDRRRLGVVLLNPGAIHRIGINRLYVTWARRWAALGARTLRLDISGIGDSPAEPGTAENRMYSPHAVSDVAAALDYLQSSSSTLDRFALVGLCSGAYAAFHAALVDPRVTSVTLINPQTFDYKPGDTLDLEKRRNFREARYYQRAAFRARSWVKALRGHVNFRYVSRVLYGRIKAAVRSLSSRVGEGLGFTKREYPLYEAFRTLIERGCDVRLVYCKDDPGLLHLSEELGGLRRKLLAAPRFHLEVIDGPDHTFTPLWSQARLTEVLDECLAFEQQPSRRRRPVRDGRTLGASLR